MLFLKTRKIILARGVDLLQANEVITQTTQTTPGIEQPVAPPGAIPSTREPENKYFKHTK